MMLVQTNYHAFYSYIYALSNYASYYFPNAKTRVHCVLPSVSSVCRMKHSVNGKPKLNPWIHGFNVTKTYM